MIKRVSDWKHSRAERIFFCLLCSQLMRSQSPHERFPLLFRELSFLYFQLCSHVVGQWVPVPASHKGPLPPIMHREFAHIHTNHDDDTKEPSSHLNGMCLYVYLYEKHVLSAVPFDLLNASTLDAFTDSSPSNGPCIYQEQTGPFFVTPILSPRLKIISSRDRD